MNSIFSIYLQKNKFIKTMSIVLTNEAKRFSGLYSGIDLIASGKNKKSYSTLCEFCQRLQYCPNCEEIYDFLNDILSKKRSYSTIRNLAIEIREAMDMANIRGTEIDAVIKLDRANVLHYKEWNGDILYVDDVVKIISPAWYQNNDFVEEGYCAILK